jgi:hypothetical protein
MIAILGCMSNRVEVSLIPAALSSGNTDVISRESVEQNAIELGAFLSDSGVDLIAVTSIIPSTKIGISYTVALGRRIKDHDGNEAINWHYADNRSIDLLQNSLDLMSKKDRKKHKDIRKNLKSIREVVSNPEYWNSPFNPDLPS